MATAQAESTIPTGSWQSDPVHSSIGFAVKHMVGTLPRHASASSTRASATPPVARRSPAARRCRASRCTEENLYGHLLSPEFFDAEQTPEIIFESNKISKDGDELVVNGELTVKGSDQARRRPRRDQRPVARPG